MMEDLSSASSYATSTWVSWFLSSKGNEYFCEVDEDYILDRFNLTGLNAEVQHYPQALDLVTDALEEELDQETRDHIEAQGRLLYGLVHARYIITSRGLNKMLEKYKRSDFGRCPRVLCYSQPLLPLGLSDLPFQKAVKLYCPRCEDIYSPKSSRHGTIDGAFFGSSFPHLLFMVYPHMLPSKSPSSQSNFAALPAPSSAHPAAQVIQQQQSITGGANSPVTNESKSAAANEDGNNNNGNAAEDSPMNVDKSSSSHDQSSHQQRLENTSTTMSSSTGSSRQQPAGSRSTSARPNSNNNGTQSQGLGPPIHKGVERYKPRIFGFPVHEVAVLHRWQERVAEQMVVGSGSNNSGNNGGGSSNNTNAR
ncbi:unnamed protein product [Sympodiomycopsis kandeliae]